MRTTDRLTTEQFGENSGSYWRNRESLGGALGGFLSRKFDRDIQSWGVARRLELHLACQGKYSFSDPVPAAKFFVTTWEDLNFGLYLETADLAEPEIEKYAHWRSFKKYLTHPTDLRARLARLFAVSDLDIGASFAPDRCGNIGCCFRSRSGIFQKRNAKDTTWRTASFEDFVDVVKSFPGSQYVDFQIYRSMSQADAIKAGPEILTVIGDFLAQLAPIYFAIVA